MILDIDVSRRKKIETCGTVQLSLTVEKCASSHQSLVNRYRETFNFASSGRSFFIRCLRKCLSLHLWRYSDRLSRKTYDMTYVKRHARKSWFYRPKNFERSDDRWSSMTFQSDTRDTLITRKDLDMTTSHEIILYWRPWMRSSIYFTSESLNSHSFYSNSSWRETLLPSYRSADNSF